MRAPQPRLPQALPNADRRDIRRALALTATVTTLALATACRAALSPLLGPTNGTTSTADQTTPADQFFTAFANRYTNVNRDAQVQAARTKLADGALIPSRIFDDSSTWTTLRSDDARVFAYAGAATGGRYVMRAMPAGVLPPLPASPGATRHVITLTKLADEEFHWDIRTDFSFGAAGASNVASLFRAFFESAERRTDRDVRADYRATFPRTTAALGLLFSVDSLRSTTLADGSSLVHLELDAHAESLSRRYPLFAKYLEKYVSPGVMRLVLRDKAGGATPGTPAIPAAPDTWFVVDMRRDRVVFQFRSREGRLLPLNGPARAMPDTLELESLVSAKIGIFRVGFEQLRSDFIITREEGEPAWTMVFRREPAWKLPLFTESLIRSSLRRPFEQGGAFFRMSLREEGGQTIFSRHGVLAVKEGTILRFLGRLGSRAYSDLSTRVEKEIQEYLREVFTAMRRDAEVR